MKSWRNFKPEGLLRTTCKNDCSEIRTTSIFKNYEPEDLLRTKRTVKNFHIIKYNSTKMSWKLDWIMMNYAFIIANAILYSIKKPYLYTLISRSYSINKSSLYTLISRSYMPELYFINTLKHFWLKILFLMVWYRH